jgi:hypothetical protein
MPDDGSICIVLEPFPTLFDQRLFILDVRPETSDTLLSIPRLAVQAAQN